MFRNLKRASTGISLVVLWLGFSLLGILSFINRLQGESTMAPGVERECCLAGSAGSVFAGHDISGGRMYVLEAVR
jgi:hypothetical protein